MTWAEIWSNALEAGRDLHIMTTTPPSLARDVQAQDAGNSEPEESPIWSLKSVAYGPEAGWETAQQLDIIELHNSAAKSDGSPSSPHGRSRMH